jgi:hypothetical protein
MEQKLTRKDELIFMAAAQFYAASLTRNGIPQVERCVKDAKDLYEAAINDQP